MTQMSSFILRLGAEVLDEQVHQQHGTVGYENEDRCERAGEAVRALLGEFVDLNGDEQELRRDEQDYRGDGGDAAHERGNEAGEERILDGAAASRS